MILENQGSVARDHLASERTFLAYVRTSLTIASIGVALFQLLSINTPCGAKPFARHFGAVTIATALVVLAIGVSRYFSIQDALTRGMFPVARLTVIGMAAVLAALVSSVFVALVRQ